MIIFDKVGVTFAGGGNALNNISVNIKRGEFVYVIGRSGAGKSTLLRLICADIMPSRGVVKIANEDVTFLPKHRKPYLRRRMGIVFQDFMLLEDRTVFDNVRMALDIYFFKKSDITDRVWQLLKRLGIFELRDSYVKSLSGGEKQRVAIARAMVNSPEIIIADEPTGNLDRDNAMIIMQLLLQAKEGGATVIMATHDLDMVAEYPSRQLLLEHGELK